MPEGALLTRTVEAVLHDLADSGATGCLLVRDQEGDEAEVYLRDGQVYSVIVPGRRVMLGVRLMSRGALTPEALAEALEIQRTELQGWRLGELLVHLGYVDLAVVEEFVVEHLKDALADLLGWPVAAWKFRKNKKTRQDVAPPTPVAELFDDLRDRATTWETILAAIGGPDAVPALAAGSPSDEVALGPERVGPAVQGRRRAQRRRAGRRVRLHALRGRPGRHAPARGRAGRGDAAASSRRGRRGRDRGRRRVELVLPVVAIEELEAREARRQRPGAASRRRGTGRAEAREAAEQAEAERSEAEQAEAERDRAPS